LAGSRSRIRGGVGRRDRAGTDALEDEALRRAKDKSDTLLIFLLKARRPEKYKDRV
jgi:hypothetical protein